jgi:transcriptional regulator with XRE-family HTH domain
MSSVSEAIAAEFSRILTERKLSVSAAARELHVSRQAFHSYLNGTSTPRHKTLGRAMDLWNFQLRIGNEVFDRSSFPKGPKLVQSQEQLPFVWEALDAIKKQNLKVGVCREGSVFKVEVKIDIPA